MWSYTSFSQRQLLLEVRRRHTGLRNEKSIALDFLRKLAVTSKGQVAVLCPVKHSKD
jgi:hypothetical protein